MKITVITPVYNGQETIRSCIESVSNQSLSCKEHIIVDGGSTDKTIDVLKGHPVRWISEKDNGIYDAFNKGINMATGDIICFLGADDMYADTNVFQSIVDTFIARPEIAIVYGDMIFVKRGDISKITRYWKSSPFKPGLFRKGWLPQNHALFIRRSVFHEYGSFDLQYRSASDYELQYRLFEKLQLNSFYLPGIMVKMRAGGVSNSNLRNVYKNLKECYDILKFHKVKYPFPYIINTIFYRFKQAFVPSNIKKMYQSK
jgi:glycosyltransferase involved in cell wall biosynthesis